MREIEGKDLVAIVGIITFGILIYHGKDGAIIALISTIIGWYFGSKKS